MASGFLHQVQTYLTLPSEISREKRASLWVVFFVSFCWSTSSLMVFAVLPSYLSDELGVSHKVIGFMEGGAIFLAFFGKVLSGIISDLQRKRTPLILVGSFLTIIAKICFAFSVGVNSVFLARVVDRFSKGIRSAPTDALLADLSSGIEYGKIYGLRQSFYTVGAVCGASLSMILMNYFTASYRLIFSLSTIPALVSLILLAHLHEASSVTRRYNKIIKERGLKLLPEILRWVSLRYKKIPSSKGTKPLKTLAEKKEPWSFLDLKKLPMSYWYLMSIVIFLMTARFSETFINLRMKELGVSVSCLPLIIIVMDLVHAGLAYPFGKLSDHISREKILLCGMLVQLLASLLMSFTESYLFGFVIIALIGVYMGMTQGILRAMIAQITPANMRGTAFSLFYLISGVAVLWGNAIAGTLSDQYGLFAAFSGSSFFTAIASILLSLKIFASYLKRFKESELLSR